MCAVLLFKVHGAERRKAGEKVTEMVDDGQARTEEYWWMVILERKLFVGNLHIGPSQNFCGSIIGVEHFL